MSSSWPSAITGEVKAKGKGKGKQYAGKGTRSNLANVSSIYQPFINDNSVANLTEDLGGVSLESSYARNSVAPTALHNKYGWSTGRESSGQGRYEAPAWQLVGSTLQPTQSASVTGANDYHHDTSFNTTHRANNPKDGQSRHSRRGSRCSGQGNISGGALLPQQTQYDQTSFTHIARGNKQQPRRQYARDEPKSQGKMSTPFASSEVGRDYSGTLKAFHLFPDLPTEIRLKVWELFNGHEERLIEIEHGINNMDIAMSKSHHYVQRVSFKSRVPPTIILINRETRSEYLRLYKKVNFDTRPNREIYYNPAKDIVFFGENTCITSIIYQVSRAYYRNFDIPRVAIRATNKHTSCHKCENWDTDDEYDVDMHRGVYGGCSVAQALYGLPDIDHQGRVIVPGCPGLKEVFFVQSSMFWPVQAGGINSSVGFRPAVGNGLTSGQKQFKADMMKAISRVQADMKIMGVSSNEENKWTGERKPNFSFVHLAPKVGSDGCMYDSVLVTFKEYGKLLKRERRAPIDKASFENKVRVTWCKPDFVQQPEREIGLFGPQKGIGKVKEVIGEVLAKV